MSVEQTIVTALVDRLATIKAGQTVTLNDATYTYSSTIRTAVDGRVVPFSDTEIPAANVFTPESSAESANLGEFLHSLQVTIVLYVAQTAAQRAIRALRKDVYAAIGSDETLGGIPGLIQIRDPSRVTKCIQTADFIGSEQITLDIIYNTSRWDV